jgi:hypothetical protein
MVVRPAQANQMWQHMRDTSEAHAQQIMLRSLDPLILYVRPDVPKGSTTCSTTSLGTKSLGVLVL